VIAFFEPEPVLERVRVPMLALFGGGDTIVPVETSVEIRVRATSPFSWNGWRRRSSTMALERMGEFWDRHDFTDFDDPTAPDVEVTVRCGIPLEPDLLARLEAQAAKRGVSAETLANLWLQEKLAEAV
jgi:hypothetical protein